MEKQHPFTAAGLGQAPFVCLEVTINSEPRFCNYCGQEIHVEFKILSADGRLLMVGRDCAKKADHELGKICERAYRKARLDAAQKSLRDPHTRALLASTPCLVFPAPVTPNRLSWCEWAIATFAHREEAVKYLLVDRFTDPACWTARRS